MPKYFSRDEEVVDENPQGGAMEILNMYGANKVVPKEEEPQEEKNELLGGMLSDIMNSKKPHKEMIRKVLQMKPKDIHIIKKSAKYFLDNQNELEGNDVEEGILEDLSKTSNSNDLADMLESDFEYTNGGELDGNSLLEGFATLINNVSKVQKQFS